MLELGGAFSAALAVDGGRIVDGLGGSSGPIGARACGALDAEVAYLLGPALSKRTVFSGGALPVLADGPEEGWLALEEGAAKAALALTVERARAARDPPHRAPGARLYASARGAARVTSRRCGSRAGSPPHTARRCWPTA